VVNQKSSHREMLGFFVVSKFT